MFENQTGFSAEVGRYILRKFNITHYFTRTSHCFIFFTNFKQLFHFRRLFKYSSIFDLLQNMTKK